MRALWVTAESPDRNMGGGSIRQAYLLEALAGRVETHLLLAGALHDQRTRAAVAGVTEVAASVRPPPRTTFRRRLRDLRRATLASGPAEVDLNVPVRAVLAPLVAARSPAFDVVVVEHSALAPLLPPVRANRWALTLHNMPSITAAHLVELAPGERQRWIYGQEARKARRFEAWAVRSYDVVFTVSDEDAAALPGPSVVVPNGVDTRRFVPTPLPTAPRLVFTGTLNFPPNIDGVRWFCDEVLPLVRTRVPGVVLDIVGRGPLPEVIELADRPGVRLHADVPDVRPHLAAARVVVVPLRMGSGTRLKALEAMAAGRPVVGTTRGLAGLGMLDGVHARIADEPEAFAEAVVALLGSESAAEALVSAGRELVERCYGWERVATTFVEALLTGAPAARGTAR